MEAKPGTESVTVEFPDLLHDREMIEGLVAMVLDWIRYCGLVDIVDPWEIISELAIYIAEDRLRPKQAGESWEDYLRQKLWDRLRTVKRRVWRERQKLWCGSDNAIATGGQSLALQLDHVYITPTPDYDATLDFSRQAEVSTNSSLSTSDPLLRNALRTCDRLIDDGRIRPGNNALLFKSVMAAWYSAGGDETFNAVADQYIKRVDGLTSTERESLRKKLHRWMKTVEIALSVSVARTDDLNGGQHE